MMIRFMIMLIACLFVLAGCGGDGSVPVAGLPTGAGTFAAKVDYGVGDSPRSVAIGDLNGDGILDLAVANAGSEIVGSDKVSVLFGNDDGTGKGDGTFAAAVDYGAGTAPVSVVIEDLNADLILDLVVANSGSDNVSVLIGNGGGTFGTATNFGVGTNPFFVTLGDLNADGNLDLAVANSGSANVSVLVGNGAGSFATAVDYGVGESPRSIAIGDLDADGFLDLAVASSGSLVDGLPVDGTDNLSVLKGNGDGTFVPVAPADIYETGTAPFSVVMGNLDADGIPDLAVANLSSNSVSVLLGAADGIFTLSPTLSVVVGPRSLAIGNLNTDLILDLVVVNSFSNSISVLIGNGDGTFAAAVAYSTGANPLSLAMGDLNGDETLDLAVVNQLSDSVSVLVGNSD